MSVRVQHDAETNVYNLGDDIEGVFIPFASVPGDSVTGRIASVNAAHEAAGTTTTTTTGRVSGNTGDDFAADDFADNGDGSYTRKSDGVQGRFTPTGFEPITAP